MSKSSRQCYAALEARTTHVSEKAIKKKWAKPQDSTQFRLRQLFASVEKSATADRATSKKSPERDAMTDLLMITYVSFVSMPSAANHRSHRFIRKIPRMMFPPKTEDAHFDYENILTRTRLLGAQLTADNHSAALLKAEIRKERRQLQQDQLELEVLEKGQRDTKAMRKQHDKGLHPLACSAQAVGASHDRRARQSHIVPDSTSTTADLDKDPTIQPLLKQLRSHLESMHNNTICVSDTKDAITRSAAALDIFTWQSAGKEHYNKIHEQ